MIKTDIFLGVQPNKMPFFQENMPRKRTHAPNVLKTMSFKRTQTNQFNLHQPQII